MVNKISLSLTVLLLCLSLFTVPRASAAAEEDFDATAKINYLNTLMNNGLIMVMDGSNLMMLADMKMATAIDPQTRKRGEDMMQRGKDLIEEALTGPDMVDLYVKGHQKAPAMEDARQLGEYILKAAYTIDDMYEGSMTNQDNMTIHHMHVLINNALSTAAAGANMVILSDLTMPGKAQLSLRQGEEMLKESRAILLDLLTGDTMREMHNRGLTPQDHKSMQHTHEHIHNGLKIIDKLSSL